MADEVNSWFSANLRRLRKEQGLSQVKLAAKAGVTNVVICHIENGHSGTLLSTAGKLASALGSTLNEMTTASPAEAEESCG